MSDLVVTPIRTGWNARGGEGEVAKSFSIAVFGACLIGHGGLGGEDARKLSSSWAIIARMRCGFRCGIFNLRLRCS